MEKDLLQKTGGKKELILDSGAASRELRDFSIVDLSIDAKLSNCNVRLQKYKDVNTPKTRIGLTNINDLTISIENVSVENVIATSDLSKKNDKGNGITLYNIS